MLKSNASPFLIFTNFTQEKIFYLLTYIEFFRFSGTTKPLMNNFYELNDKNSNTEGRNQGFEKRLEESWSSLDIFNQRHRGRISKRIDGNILKICYLSLFG